MIRTLKILLLPSSVLYFHLHYNSFYSNCKSDATLHYEAVLQKKKQAKNLICSQKKAHIHPQYCHGEASYGLNGEFVHG